MVELERYPCPEFTLQCCGATAKNFYVIQRGKGRKDSDASIPQLGDYFQCDNCGGLYELVPDGLKYLGIQKEEKRGG